MHSIKSCFCVCKNHDGLLSSTILRGTYTLRAVIVKQRSTMVDFDELVRAVAEISAMIVHEQFSRKS
ncbi:MAG: hypothetical protein H9535_15780 [Ignavibacteria bacterium]|nr:hypothetical protein [Ignavibacteria bacterium]